MAKRKVLKKPAATRTARVSHRDACPLCQKYKNWKPSVLKSIEEAHLLSADLEGGRLTRQELVDRGELLPVEEFLRRMHGRSSRVSCFWKPDLIKI